jgi:hypothetical protein
MDRSNPLHPCPIVLSNLKRKGLAQCQVLGEPYALASGFAPGNLKIQIRHFVGYASMCRLRASPSFFKGFRVTHYVHSAPATFVAGVLASNPKKCVSLRALPPAGASSVDPPVQHKSGVPAEQQERS